MGQYFDLTQMHFKLKSDSPRFHSAGGIKLAQDVLLCPAAVAGGGQHISSSVGIFFFFSFIKIYRDGGGGEVLDCFPLLPSPLFTNCNFFILSFFFLKKIISYT